MKFKCHLKKLRYLVKREQRSWSLQTIPGHLELRHCVHCTTRTDGLHSTLRSPNPYTIIGVGNTKHSFYLTKQHRTITHNIRDLNTNYTNIRHNIHKAREIVTFLELLLNCMASMHWRSWRYTILTDFCTMRPMPKQP